MNQWDERFNTEDYIFGTNPSQFIIANSHFLSPNSKVFVPADGEGRNSVYLAQNGHQVHACDYSDIGIQKAKKLAQENNVAVRYDLIDLEDWQPPFEEYDAIIAIFIQFCGPALRHQFFEKFKTAVKKNGLILLHGYTPKQLEYKTGGPPNVENLYDIALLQNEFSDFEIIKLNEYDMELNEGSGHKGKSALIDLVCRKP